MTFHTKIERANSPVTRAKRIPKSIKRVAYALGYALFLDTPDDWLGASIVLESRTKPHERAALGYAALRSLTSETIADVTNSLLPATAGAPIAPLTHHMEEASFWADLAEPDELKAYCLATFKRMSPADQAAFLAFVGGASA